MKFKTLLYPIALVSWIVMNLAFIQYSKQEYQMLEELELDINVNYAADAAIDALLISTSDLETDYTEFDSIASEPTVALDMFSRIMVRGFRWADNDINRQVIVNEYIKTFIAATYDGYYIAEPYKINEEGAYETLFSIKWPYLYREGANKVWALNMGADKALCFDGSTIVKSDSPISQETVFQQVSLTLSDALLESVYTQLEGATSNTVYIPSEMTTINVSNPVQGVTVLAYVVPPDSYVGEQYASSFGIGGTRVAHTDYVVAYHKDGYPYYCYADDLQEGVIKEHIYESPLIAAQKGYYFDTTSVSK